MVYTPSQAAIDLIKQSEGCRLDAYQDVAGVWTIGYGHTRTAKLGMKITQQQAEDLLRQDVAEFAAGVNKAVEPPIEQYQFDAILSFAYNVGLGALQNSTLLRMLNDGATVEAGLEFPRWAKATVNGKKQTVEGLLNRRLSEQRLFFGLKALA